MTFLDEWCEVDVELQNGFPDFCLVYLGCHGLEHLEDFLHHCDTSELFVHVVFNLPVAVLQSIVNLFLEFLPHDLNAHFLQVAVLLVPDALDCQVVLELLP